MCNFSAYEIQIQLRESWMKVFTWLCMSRFSTMSLRQKMLLYRNEAFRKRKAFFCVMFQRKLYQNVCWGCLPVNSGERLTGSQEVMGSIPTVSTKKDKSHDLSFFIHCESTKKASECINHPLAFIHYESNGILKIQLSYDIFFINYKGGSL